MQLIAGNDTPIVRRPQGDAVRAARPPPLAHHSPPMPAAWPIAATVSRSGRIVHSPRSGAGTPSAGTPSRLEARHFGTSSLKGARGNRVRPSCFPAAAARRVNHGVGQLRKSDAMSRASRALSPLRVRVSRSCCAGLPTSDCGRSWPEF